MDELPALRWSGSYALLPPASASQATLPGDKIILPQSALEQLLAAAPSRSLTGGPLISEPPNPYTTGFPSGRARDDGSQQLPHPLMFRLVNPANSNAVYAGIREFSAPEGTLRLSPFLLDALGIEPKGAVAANGASPDDPVDLTADGATPSPVRITVHAQQLPKGTYVRLRPLEAGYNPDDWKSLLERHLRQNFTCLTKDAILTVHGVHGETFKFLMDKFAPQGDAICVVDTDLEVDIEALNEEQARETLRQIMSKGQSELAHGSSKGELDIWKDVQGQVSPGDYVDYTLPSWDRSRPLTIALSDIQQKDSLDVFVSPKSPRHRALPRDSAHVFGNLGPADRGVKFICITPTDVELEGAESVLVSVHAYCPDDTAQQSSGPISYKLRAKSAGAHGKTGDAMDVDHESHGADDEQCKNCLQWVPKRTMVLHENFCRRDNILCSQCKSVFKKGSAEWEAHWHCDGDDAHGDSAAGKAKHDDVFHKDRRCPSCEFFTDSLPDLARHRTTVCPGKLILCRFCHLEVPQEGDPFNPSPEVVLSGMTAHELADGARTTECHLCDNIVRLRDMETHFKHHEIGKVNRSRPQICRNATCGRTLHGVGPRGQVDMGTAQGQGPGNEAGFCSLCFGPLYVSMHDPEGKALRRRIERRYLGQLMAGCGKAHCANEWCKTGRANAGLDPKGSSTKAALPLVKPLLEKVADRGEPMFFCVDEANQRRRRLAEMVAAEKGWDMEWCVAAAEAEKGNVDRMRDWLLAWAPRR